MKFKIDIISNGKLSIGHGKNKQTFHTSCNICTWTTVSYDNSAIVVVFSIYAILFESNDIF